MSRSRRSRPRSGRRNPEEAGATVVGWAGLPLMILGAIGMAGILAAARAGKVAAAETTANPTPENLYPGFAALSAADQAQVLAAPESERQNLVNTLWANEQATAQATGPSAPEAANALIDPTFLSPSG